jgi:hypothetical protein
VAHLNAGSGTNTGRAFYQKGVDAGFTAEPLERYISEVVVKIKRALPHWFTVSAFPDH